MKRSFTAIKSLTVLDNAIDFLKMGCWVGTLDEGGERLAYGLNYQVLLRAKPQILVVSESSRVRTRIGKYFGAGFRIAEAADHLEAEQLARHLSPTLILATDAITTDGCLALRWKRIQQAGIAPAAVFLLTNTVLQALTTVQRMQPTLCQSIAANAIAQKPKALISTTT